MREELKETMNKELKKKAKKVSTKRISIETKIIKRNQAEISGLKNTITRMKNSHEGFNSTCEQTQESLNSKAGQLKLSSLRRKLKRAQERPVEHYQAYEYRHNENPKRKEKKIPERDKEYLKK